MTILKEQDAVLADRRKEDYKVLVIKNSCRTGIQNDYLELGFVEKRENELYCRFDLPRIVENVFNGAQQSTPMKRIMTNIIAGLRNVLFESNFNSGKKIRKKTIDCQGILPETYYFNKNHKCNSYRLNDNSSIKAFVVSSNQSKRLYDSHRLLSVFHDLLNENESVRLNVPEVKILLSIPYLQHNASSIFEGEDLNKVENNVISLLSSQALTQSSFLQNTVVERKMNKSEIKKRIGMEPYEYEIKVSVNDEGDNTLHAGEKYDLHVDLMVESENQSVEFLDTFKVYFFANKIQMTKKSYQPFSFKDFKNGKCKFPIIPDGKGETEFHVNVFQNSNVIFNKAYEFKIT